MDRRTGALGGEDFERASGIREVVEGEFGAGREEFGGGEAAGADAQGFGASTVRGFDIERGIAENDGVAGVGVGFEAGGEFADAGGDEIGADGVVVAEASAKEVLPEAEVAELGLRATANVAGGEAEAGLFDGKRGEEFGDAGKNGTAFRGEGAREVFEVGLDIAREVGFEFVAALAVLFQDFDEDAAVGAAIEGDALGGAFDGPEAGEGRFHGGAAGAGGGDERQVNIEEDKARHRAIVDWQWSIVD